MFAVSLAAGCRRLRGGPGYGLMLAMPYAVATPAPARSFNEHGFLVVPHAIDPTDLAQVMHCCDVVLQKNETTAFDCARSTAFASALMRGPVALWYDRFRGKPPGWSAATLAREWKCK